MTDAKQPDDRSPVEQAKEQAKTAASGLADFGRTQAPKARAFLQKAVSSGKQLFSTRKMGAEDRHPDDPVPSHYEVIQGAHRVQVHPPWCSYRMDRDGIAHLSFVCHRQFYWWAWWIVLTMGPMFSLGVGLIIATMVPPTVDNQYVGIQALATVLLYGTALSLIVAVIFFACSRARMAISVGRETIKINMYTYDRRYFHGLSLGSTVSNQSGSRTFESIWIRYGQWGLYTPWLMRQDQAVVTMLWVAWIISKFDAVAQEKRAFDPSIGIRDDGFD